MNSNDNISNTTLSERRMDYEDRTIESSKQHRQQQQQNQQQQHQQHKHKIRDLSDSMSTTETQMESAQNIKSSYGQQQGIVTEQHHQYIPHHEMNDGWQRDMENQIGRKMVAAKIVKLLQQRKPNAPEEWLKKLPQMAKRLEESLYRSASSFVDYYDFNTLKHRLQQLAMTMSIGMNKTKRIQGDDYHLVQQQQQQNDQNAARFQVQQPLMHQQQRPAAPTHQLNGMDATAMSSSTKEKPDGGSDEVVTKNIKKSRKKRKVQPPVARPSSPPRITNNNKNSNGSTNDLKKSMNNNAMEDMAPSSEHMLPNTITKQQHRLNTKGDKPMKKSRKKKETILQKNKSSKSDGISHQQSNNDKEVNNFDKEVNNNEDRSTSINRGSSLPPKKLIKQKADSNTTSSTPRYSFKNAVNDMLRHALKEDQDSTLGSIVDNSTTDNEGVSHVIMTLGQENKVMAVKSDRSLLHSTTRRKSLGVTSTNHTVLNKVDKLPTNITTPSKKRKKVHSPSCQDTNAMIVTSPISSEHDEESNSIGHIESIAVPSNTDQDDSSEKKKCVVNVVESMVLIANNCSTSQSSFECLTDPITCNSSITKTRQLNNVLGDKNVYTLTETTPTEAPLVKTYRDFLSLSDEEVLGKLSTKNNRNRLIETFPVKLHCILERSVEDGYSPIISWLRHGRGFKIHDNNLFLRTVMPRFFYQTKMSSFIRQLSSYGFHKIIGQNNFDKDCFYHELFLLGRPALAAIIDRRKKRCLVDPNNEPTFSNFDPMPSLGEGLQTDGLKAEEPDQDEFRPRIIQYSYDKPKVGRENQSAPPKSNFFEN